MARENKSCLTIVLAAMLLFSLCTAYLNWVKYVSLRSTYPKDLGFFHHNASLYAHGGTTHYVLVTAFFDEQDHDGPSFYRSTHFHPIFLLVVQLYRVWPHIGCLMLIQSLCIAAGAAPLFLFASRRCGNPRLGLLMALSYLLHPAVAHLAFNDFRTIQLGLSAALFALWFHAERRPWPFTLASLLMLSCRPEYLFLLAFFGLMNFRIAAFRKQDWRWILAPILMAAIWAALTNIYYLSAYGRAWPILSSRVSGDPLGSVDTKLADSIPVFARIALFPALVGLFFPEVSVVALPFLIGSDKVELPSFPHHGLQQLTPAFAAVFWAYACSVVWAWPRIVRLPRGAGAAQLVLLLATLVSFVHFGWGAAHTYLVGGYPRYEEIDRIQQELPEEATVMAAKGIFARFSGHRRVFTYEGLPYGTDSVPPTSELKAMVAQLIFVCDLVATEDRDEWIDAWIESSGRYQPALKVSRFHIYVARKDAVRPSNPDVSLQKILRWDQMSPIKRRWAHIQ